MKESVNKLELDNEFYTQERCYINELLNTPEDPDVSIAQARVKPGVSTQWHRLKGTVEHYCIVSGRGRVEVGKLAPQEVNSGDIVIIPPKCRQRITNLGHEDLVFLAICTPRFLPENYEVIENNE